MKKSKNNNKKRQRKKNSMYTDIKPNTKSKSMKKKKSSYLQILHDYVVCIDLNLFLLASITFSSLSFSLPAWTLFLLIPFSYFFFSSFPYVFRSTVFAYNRFYAIGTHKFTETCKLTHSFALQHIITCIRWLAVYHQR